MHKLQQPGKSRYQINSMENESVKSIKNRASAPIGIFDSGIGGLTAANAISKLLPKETLIYFGDTAHLPYGDKSTAAIQAYSVKIADVLLRQNCKLILIACNSASAAAYDLVREYVGSKAKVMNVIDPVVNHLREHYANKRVGLIGTKQTVGSGVYKRKVDELDAGIELKTLATPLLAPLIEEGFHEKGISQQIVNEYLTDKSLADIEAIVLACTHYPLIKPQIDQFYENKVDIIDYARVVAEALRAYLEFNGLLARERSGENHFMVSDYTRSFEASTRIFFKEAVNLEKYPLWE